MSDDILDDEDARLEERFRELEYEAEIERLRRDAGEPTRQGGGQRDAGPEAREDATGDDPLSTMKAALDSDAEIERFVLALCPHCSAKNRISLTRLRGGEPRCGGCKQDLSFTKV